MHKKPLVAVFVLGFLLLAVAASWGTPVPNKDGAVLNSKGKGTPSTNLQVSPEGTTPAVQAQAGTPLALPGTFCTGNWMGSRRYSYFGTFIGGEIYYSFQDPSLTFPYSWNAAGCSPSYTFNVSAIDMEVSKRPTSEGVPNPFTFDLQPIVFNADLTDPACPFPGAVLCAGPVYAVTLTGGTTTGVTYLVNLPFTIECCVTGPYFAGMYLAGTWAHSIANVIVDDVTSTTPPPPVPLPCYGYIYGDGPPWGIYSWVNDWLAVSRNLRMWSEGYTPNDPATQCTPGDCGWQNWNGKGHFEVDYTDPDLFAYTIPNASGSRSAMSVRLVSDGLDTLKEIAFFGWAYAGTPDVLIEIRDPQPGSSCGMPTEPGALRYSVVVPFASLIDDPLPNIVPVPDQVWGVLNGGLPQDLFVTLSVVGGLPNRYALLTRTAQYGACGIDPHTMFEVGGGAGVWIYGGDYFGDDDEAFIEGNICKEVVPIVPAVCSPAGPDDWNTWAHDYQRTNASSINLGDPCAVRAQWSTYLPRISSFNSPVVAGGKVYVSTDNEVNMYDLASGIPLGSVGIFPYMGGQVRSNVTVEGNRVFMTGGTATAVSCWDTLLTTAFWSDDLTGPGLTTTTRGKLLTRNRFGVATVYMVGTDSVVVVGTEMTTNTNNGFLYALDATTGYLYTGWGTNPIPLDRGAFYTPAYDGTNLYVGTGAFGTLGDGSLYSIDAASGVVNWNYKDALNPLEGWPGGVSVEGGMLYAATYYYDATLSASSGHRYAIDKSAAMVPATTPTIAWKGANGPTLYASPTVGRNFLYIPQDNPSAGLLMVDKALGKIVYNWSANGVSSISQHVALTCDKFLFAGTRDGYWYLLNAMDQSMEWRREFPGAIVNGTAIAHHAITGDDYAVVNSRSSLTDPSGFGVVTGWRFNQATRPFMLQNVYETDQILVPLNSGDGLAASLAGVYSNTGCVNLNITGSFVYELSPTAAVHTQLQREYAEAYADRKTGSDYLTYFEGGQVSKKARMAGLGTMVDGDLTGLDVAADAARAGLTKNASKRSMAAGANDIIRTHQSSVVYSANPILPGGTTGISWLFDGTDLGRGADDEWLESVNDDPDFYPEDLAYDDFGYPGIVIHYLGGCPNANTPLNWNTLGATNTEKVYNFGSLGGMNANGDHALKWGADPTGSDAWLFDGGLVLAGDSSAAIGGALVRIGLYSDNARNFLPDPRISDATCGFDGETNIHLGWYRTQGCPGQAVEVLGSWVRSTFSDSLEAVAPTSPLACMGLSIAQYEVGANDPMYGDFKLIRWAFQNRDAVLKSNIYAGSFVDWDIAAGTDNTGAYRDDYNGYFVRATTSPVSAYAYGLFIPEMPSAYCGIDAAAHPAHRIEVVSNPDRVYDPGAWTAGPTKHGEVWHQVVNQQPTRGVDNGTTTEDKSGLLVNQPFNLAASGNAAVHQALYAVDASSEDENVIGAAGLAVATRAARWAGFARGDVNDDGCINLGDVCWVLSPNQIYPDTYCGDVNLDGLVNGADQSYLLNFVSGLGPAPQGAWRFTF